MSEDLPKGKERGKAVVGRRWGLYIQVLAILLLVGAGIGLALRESTSSDTPEGKVRALVAELERQYSGDWLSQLLRELIPGYGRGRERYKVANDLAALGVDAVPEIITAAKHRVPYVRSAAARALGVIGDRRAVAPLADLLARDSFPEVRNEAATSLGRLGGPEATDGLTKAIADSDPYVRKAVVSALGKVGGPEAAARLIETMDDSDSGVRCYVAEALGRVGGPKAAARLIEAMDDSEPHVRYWVAEALGKVGGPEATARLTEAMTDPDPKVRDAAREALQRIRAVGQAQTPSAPPQN